VRQEPFWANDPIAAPTRQQREPAPFWANDPAATPRPSVPQDGPDAPFQPELAPGDNGVYPPMRPGFEAVGTPQAPIDTIGAEEAAANRNVFGAQGTRLDPIDLNTLPPEDRAYLNAGMYVKLGNGEVRRMMADARPNAGGPGTQEIRPGLFIEENADVGTDIAKSIPTGVVEGITAILGLPGMLGDVGAGGGVASNALLSMLPTGAEMNQGISDRIGYSYYQPQTVPGEYARTLGEFLPGGVAPGGVGTKIASVAVPAFTSETAGQIARGMSGGRPDTDAENYARLLGGLGGGLGVGAFSAVRGGVDNVLANAAPNVTPQQLHMAAALSASGDILGNPLTRAEAVQQATGGATNLGRVQRVIEGTTNRLGPMMAARPERVERALAGVLDQIGPLVEPGPLAGQTRAAANRVLENTRARINAQARPFYGAADQQVVSAEEYAALREIPTYREAEAAFFGSPELSAGVGGPQSVSAINRVIQEMDTLARNADAGPMAPNANANLARVRGEASDLAKGIVDIASPEYAQARAIGAAGRQAELVPIQRGPLGSIARQDELQPDLGATQGRLFPPSPYGGQAQETARALQLMGDVDPTVGGPLVRQQLEQQAAEAMQRNVSGPNPFGGAKFAATQFGNRLQSDTMLGAVDTVAPMASRDIRDLIENFRATGQREPQGSNTSFNNILAAEMQGGNVAQESWASLLSPLRVPGRVAGAIDDMTARANANTLADLLAGSSDEFNARLLRAINRPRGANRIRAGVAVAAGQED